MKILWATTSSMSVEPIVGSLSSVSEWDHEIEHYRFDVEDGDFLQKVKESPPDVFIYIGHAERPSDEFLAHICGVRERGAKTVMICCDGACPHWWDILWTLRQHGCFDTIVNIDGNKEWPEEKDGLTLLCPLDIRYYTSTIPMSLRSSSVGFLGGLSPERRHFIEPLARSGLLQLGTRNERWGSYKQYAEFTRNCKIVVNMGRTGSGQAYHVKARVLEAGLAGCVVMEEAGSPTPQWFKRGEDYLEFDGVAHLKDLVIEQLKSSHDLDKMGQRLRNKILSNHSPRHFWSKVFQKIGKMP